MEILVIQSLHGLVYGMLLFLVASGLTLVFGMMDVLNIAHASFYMLAQALFKVRGYKKRHFSAVLQFFYCVESLTFF